MYEVFIYSTEKERFTYLTESSTLEGAIASTTGHRLYKIFKDGQVVHKQIWVPQPSYFAQKYVNP